MTRGEEVAKCFEENPELVKMSPAKMAEWFYIQGELKVGNAAEGIRNKLIHFKKYMNEEEKAQAEAEWSKYTKTE